MQTDLTILCNKIRACNVPFTLNVQSESMLPVLCKGQSISIIPYANVKNIVVGDIIVYCKFRDHLTVHRVINIVLLNDRRFYCETKGDNNVSADRYKVFNHEIIGVVNLKT